MSNEVPSRTSVHVVVCGRTSAHKRAEAMAYRAMAQTVTAYTVMANIIMAYMVMACGEPVP